MTNNLYITLKDRAVFSVSGSDASKFLQGLITNNINKVDDKNVIYALMLTPQGKFLYDFFIAKRENKYLIDCNKEQLLNILKKFNMYKLRSDVVIADESDFYEVTAVIGDKVFEVIDKDEHSDVRPFCKGVAYIDPRTPKVFARSFIERENENQSFKAYDFSKGTFDDYEKVRINAGVPTGNVDLISEDSFPHDFGMNEFHAIDYNKGCYVGQEVTARVEHKGSKRKALYIVESAENKAMPEIGSDITHEGKKIGILLSSHKGVALAILNKEMIEKHIFSYSVGDSNITLRR